MIELLWNAPVSEARMAVMIETLSLKPHHRVLDVGCGCGEVLIRVFERFGIQGTGIDSSAEHVAEARRRSEGRVTGSRLEFVEADAESFAFEAETLDLVMCLGATHAFGLGGGAVERAIGRMLQLVAPGGLILVADGYLKQPKPPGYRKYVGDDLPEEQTHAAIVAMGREAGLVPLAAWTSSVNEWDDFEWAYQRIVERKAVEHPEDAAAIEKRDRRREWMDAYLKWGRDTLGYGTYLFRKTK